MKTFDCQLDHHPLVRIDAESPEAAKTEYFRRYAISSSMADWHCGEAVAGSAAPIEPESWINRRKELGTWEDRQRSAKGAPAERQGSATAASDKETAAP